MAMLRKLLRRAFFIAAATSMLLLLATLILWPVSYHREMVVYYTTLGRMPFHSQLGIHIISGRLDFSRELVSRGQSTIFFFTRKPESSDYVTNDWSYADHQNLVTSYGMSEKMRVGIMFVDLPEFPVWGGRFDDIDLFIPCSYFALLFSILPLLAFRSIRRRRKKRRDALLGLCPKCRYNLKAHPPGSICPECGTPVGA